MKIVFASFLLGFKWFNIDSPVLEDRWRQIGIDGLFNQTFLKLVSVYKVRTYSN